VLFNTLKETGLPVATGTGGQTKFNRTSVLASPKGHALDAACVGEIGDVRRPAQPVLQREVQRTGITLSHTGWMPMGFPRGYLMQGKSVHGFRTGDMVKATVSKGKKVGTYTGRVAVRATGNFNIQTSNGVVQGVAHRYCTVMQRGDGYSYSRVATMDATKGTPPQHRDALHPALSLPAVNDRVSRAI
jgi:hypothetical protein